MPTSSGDKKTTYRRRNIFSQPAGQSRLILSAMLGAVAFLALNIGLGVSLLQDFRLTAQSLPVETQTITDLDIIWKDALRTFLLQALLYGGALFLLLGALMLYMSHKIMGPIGKLHRYVRGVVDGTEVPQRVYFRKGDFFSDLPEDFNAFQKLCGLNVSGADKPAEKPFDG